ncbi:Chitinase [Helicobacter heilmannii]|nr:Chitinase [Helicobacter heilmannii]
MGAMFRLCVAFNQPLLSWDISSVADMGGMLMGAWRLTKI